jgi:hypothetical protein
VIAEAEAAGLLVDAGDHSIAGILAQAGLFGAGLGGVDGGEAALFEAEAEAERAAERGFGLRQAAGEGAREGFEAGLISAG